MALYMTLEELSEIKRLLAAYRAARHPPGNAIRRARAHLETVLVRHADALIAAAEAETRHQELKAA